MFWLNRLYDEYMMIRLKQTAIEKKHCETAANHTYYKNNNNNIHK